MLAKWNFVSNSINQHNQFYRLEFFDDPLSGANNTSILLTPTHFFSTTGTYNIRSIVNFSCGVDTIFKTISVTNCENFEDDCQLFVSNVFTPNADGVNESFYPSTICPFEHYECLVYNRWGGLTFKTSNQSEKWAGKYKGADCSDGVYFYLISYKFKAQQTKNIYGTVTLLR